MVHIFTIGFTKKPARTFFGLLKESEASRLVDVRLNNVSQLAGFAKRDDLEFFLNTICGMTYSHATALAPTKPMLDAFKKDGGSWPVYESEFLGLMRERRIEESIDPTVLDNAVLLCSEEKPHLCHRRLVAEYFQDRWRDVQITHLG